MKGIQKQGASSSSSSSSSDLKRMDISNNIIDANDSINSSRLESSTMMIKTTAQIIPNSDDDVDESSIITTADGSCSGTVPSRRLSSQLHGLSKCQSFWHSLPLQYWTRPQKRPFCPHRKSQRRFPVLPHTTLLEILSFCDASTSLAFRGYSRVFRDHEIPRLFHDRAMTKMNPLSSENEHHQVPKRPRRRKLPTTTSGRDNNNNKESVREAIRYSYKRKVVDEEDRKVWIFLRDQTKNNNSGDDVPRIQQQQQQQQQQQYSRTTSSTCSNYKKTFDAHPHHWSLQAVTTKVLKMIHDCEFYDGAVYGYDENKAKELLLQKGCIDDGDFPQPMQLPSSSSLSNKNKNRNALLRRSSSRTFPPTYGKWRAEASVRSISLQEALEILSAGNNGSMHVDVGKRQRRRRWKSPFPKRSKRKNKNNTQIRQSGSVDEMVLSLLLAASGRSSLSEYDNAASEPAAITASATTADGVGDDEDGVGIRLAEYSTVFENIKMSCSVLLIHTIGGAEAEVRVLSVRVEHDRLEPGRGAGGGLPETRFLRFRGIPTLFCFRFPGIRTFL